MDESENKQDEIIVDADEVKESSAPDPRSIKVKNPKEDQVRRLEEEAGYAKGFEMQRSEQLKIEQDYVNRFLSSVKDNYDDAKRQKAENDAFEEQIRMQVYGMHGISKDKLEGMNQRSIAWYQGAAFAFFVLSCALIFLTGYFYGFSDSLTLFCAFYTAIEGTLLTNGKRSFFVMYFLTKLLYLLLFPSMLFMFLLRQLDYSRYRTMIPYFALAGVVILIIGALTYFTYNPYREDKKKQKQADHYLKKMAKAAEHGLKLQDKELEKQRKAEEKEKEKVRKQQDKEREAQKRQEEKEKEKQRRQEEKEKERQRKREEKEKEKQRRQEEKLQQKQRKQEEAAGNEADAPAVPGDGAEPGSQQDGNDTQGQAGPGSTTEG